MTFGIPFQRVHDVKALGFHQLFGRFKRLFLFMRKFLVNPVLSCPLCEGTPIFGPCGQQFSDLLKGPDFSATFCWASTNSSGVGSSHQGEKNPSCRSPVKTEDEPVESGRLVTMRVKYQNDLQGTRLPGAFSSRLLARSAKLHEPDHGSGNRGSGRRVFIGQAKERLINHAEI